MDLDALEDQDRALVRRVLAAPSEVRAALLVMLESAREGAACAAAQVMATPDVDMRELAWIDTRELRLQAPAGVLHAVFDGHAPLDLGACYSVAGEEIILHRPPVFTVRAVVAA
ncbi:MAG TPA: hypothetical protein VGN96_03920 [Roseococcus sp.]|jgi:hypothetical protein|nr:hypothetical protein [Roseococcus sp.]